MSPQIHIRADKERKKKQEEDSLKLLGSRRPSFYTENELRMVVYPLSFLATNHDTILNSPLNKGITTNIFILSENYSRHGVFCMPMLVVHQLSFSACRLENLPAQRKIRY